MNNSKCILVTGATGAVGPIVVSALCDAGFRVRTFSMGPKPVNTWPDDVEAVIGDVTDASAVQSVMKGVDAVIHLAALLHVVNPPPALQEKYERINVGGTATVVGAAVHAGAKRVLLFSTIAVYGASSDGQIFTESTPPNPDSFYAQTKLAAEKIVLEAKGADGGKIGTVLRFGAVYGSRIKGNYHRLIYALARGRFIPLGKGANRRTLVYEKDVARAAVLALTHPDAAGKIFNVSDGQYHTMNHIISSMCLALGRKPPLLSLPVAPIRFAVGVFEDVMQLFGMNPPVRRATIEKYVEDIAVDSRLIQKELGFVPQYDLLAGWKDTILEARKIHEM